MSLPSLPSITKLQHNLLRILGQNPGKFTLQGTNTYLVGPKHALVLIDTAQGLPEYLPVISEAFKRLSVGADFALEGPTTTQADQEEKAERGKVEVKEIILTHYHGDHVNGLESVLRLIKDYGFGGTEGGPRIWKVPAGKEHDEEIEESLAGMTDCFRSPSTTPDSPFKYLHQLVEGQKFTFETAEDPSNEDELEIMLTPGHTSDSISLLYTSALSHSSSDRSTSLFSADTVLGHGTAVFENLSQYITSLQRCVERLEGEEKVRLWPGHGEVIEDGVEKMKEYIRHRLERENQVVDALQHFSTLPTSSAPSPPDQGTSAETITARVYGTTISAELIPAATRGVLLHLDKLLAEGKVERIKNTWGDTSADWMEGWSDGWTTQGAVTENL